MMTSDALVITPQRLPGVSASEVRSMMLPLMVALLAGRSLAPVVPSISMAELPKFTNRLSDTMTCVAQAAARIAQPP